MRYQKMTDFRPTRDGKFISLNYIEKLSAFQLSTLGQGSSKGLTSRLDVRIEDPSSECRAFRYQEEDCPRGELHPKSALA
jgi:hypothetical protein